MNMLEIILVNSIFVLFPLFSYLIYEICMENASVKKKEFFLDFALITSCYLIFKFGYSYSSIIPKIMFHIPLIFAYLLNRKLSIFVLSFVGIIYYNSYQFGIYVVLIEYVIYYILYMLKQKNKKFEFLYIKLFILVNTIISFYWVIKSNNPLFPLSWKIIIIAITYYLLITLIVNMFNKFDGVANIYINIKDLQQLKEVRETLFKITHEIKNPIAVCKGYLDMFDVNNNEHSKNYIPIIKSEINRSLILLQDFLSLNKISIEKDILDIQLLLNKVIDNFQLSLKEKKIKIIFNEIDDEIFIDGDYNRLLQVFLNIIKNSIESIKDEGTIEINLNSLDDKIIIEVIDNGEGISKENLEKLKRPFFTTKQDGTGLGVTLSNEIIEAHKGKLDYYSELGKGTKVVVMLDKYI